MRVLSAVSPKRPCPDPVLGMSLGRSAVLPEDAGQYPETAWVRFGKGGPADGADIRILKRAPFAGRAESYPFSRSQTAEAPRGRSVFPDGSRAQKNAGRMPGPALQSACAQSSNRTVAA